MDNHSSFGDHDTQRENRPCTFRLITYFVVEISTDAPTRATDSYCRGAAAGTQGLLPAESTAGWQPGRIQCAGDKFAGSEFEQPKAGPEGARAGSPSNLTRCHGVFAPNSPHRALVTKAGRGRGARRGASDEVEEDRPAGRRMALSWAQRLKRVFGIDIETCTECGGPVRIIASIDDPVVIKKILAHLEQAGPGSGVLRLPEPRASPDVFG